MRSTGWKPHREWRPRPDMSAAPTVLFHFCSLPSTPLPSKMMMKLWQWKVFKEKWFVTQTFIWYLLTEGEPLLLEVRRNGSSSVKYLDSLGEYQLLQDRDHNGRPVYQSLARSDRYIIYFGKIYSNTYHNIDIRIHARISLVHHAWYFQ